MAFKFKKIPDVAVDVPFKIPGDYGKTTDAKIAVRFKLLKRSELKEFLETPEDDRLDDDTILHRDIVDIEGVADEDGNAEAFSHELLAGLLDESYIFKAIIHAWWDVQANRAAHAEKN